MDTPALSLLDDELSVLVNHFGIERVRTALDRIGGPIPEKVPHAQSKTPRDRRPIRTSLAKKIDELREGDLSRHELLEPFAERLGDRSILPESDDIRRFSQVVGMKSIDGKSRRDLANELLEFLLDVPVEQLMEVLPVASKISEKQRRQGFGILTDRLLDGTKDRTP